MDLIQTLFPLSNAQWTEKSTHGEYPHYTTTIYRYILQDDTVIENFKRLYILNICRKPAFTWHKLFFKMVEQ